MRRWAVIGLALAAGIASGGAPEVLSGAYVHAGGEAEARAVAAAVDQAVKAMNMLARPIARPRLQHATRAWETFTLTIHTNAVRFTRPGRPDFAVALGGAAAEWIGDDGKSYQASFAAAADGTVTQTVTAEDGGRVQVFALGADGSTLTVATTVNSPKLKKPLTYQRMYRRRDSDGRVPASQE